MDSRFNPSDFTLGMKIEKFVQSYSATRRALPWPPNKLFNKLANLATPEYEIHGFQIPYYTFQDSSLFSHL